MKILKKILILFLCLFCLCSCGEQTVPEGNEDKEDYIDPVKDVFIFGELDEGLQKDLKTANCHSDYQNYQFKMLEKEVYQNDLYDINDDLIDLKKYDEFCMEVVSTECMHCIRQLRVLPELIQDKDLTFIQYFNVGTKDEILALYEKEGLEIPENMIIISRDDGLWEYLKNVLQIKAYPSLLCFKKGKLTFMSVGEHDEESFEMLLNYGFKNALNVHNLKDENGEELIKSSRNKDDVRNDLSEENRARLEALDHDDYTTDLTYQLMGKKVDFTFAGNANSDVYVSEIDDFSKYEDEKLVLIYTYLRDNSETDKVNFINELMLANKDVRYIVVLVEGLESSSAALKNMSIGFTCPTVSVLGKIPDDFYSFGMISYPTAVFVDRGTFTGAYSEVESKEKIAEAIEMFLGEECIAYKRSN